MEESIAQKLAARFRSGDEFDSYDRDVIDRLLRHTVVSSGAARGERDRLYRKYRETAYPKLRDVRARARRVYDDVARYWRGRWRRDKDANAPPSDIKNTPVEVLWHLLHYGEPVSVSALRTILK